MESFGGPLLNTDGSLDVASGDYAGWVHCAALTRGHVAFVRHDSGWGAIILTFIPRPTT